MAPGPDNPQFEDHAAGTLAFFQSLHDSLQLIHDVNLKPVIGESAATVRPVLAESRLSGRSQRNIVVTLEALQALYLGEAGAGLGELTAAADPKLDRLMRKAFRLTLVSRRSPSTAPSRVPRPIPRSGRWSRSSPSRCGR